MTAEPNHIPPDESTDEFKQHLEHLSESCSMISRLLNADLECSGEQVSPIVREQVRTLFDNLSRLTSGTTGLAAENQGFAKLAWQRHSPSRRTNVPSSVSPDSREAETFVAADRWCIVRADIQSDQLDSSSQLEAQGLRDACREATPTHLRTGRNVAKPGDLVTARHDVDSARTNKFASLSSDTHIGTEVEHVGVEEPPFLGFRGRVGQIAVEMHEFIKVRTRQTLDRRSMRFRRRW